MKKNVNEEEWGFIRETQEIANKAGIDADTKLHRTGLEKYLAKIFPEIKESEWIHNKTIPHFCLRTRPDYRCGNLIIEVDGLPHYQKPDVILRDIVNTKKYEQLGYTVVRIPYFIQLTNEVNIHYVW